MDLSIHTNLLTMTSIILFSYCKKVFTHTNELMIGKYSIKRHNLSKKIFFNYLNMEDITNSDYIHAKSVWKDFELNILGEHHNLYAQSNILLPADVFNNFQNMCPEIKGLDPAHLLSALGLAWQIALINTKVKLDPLTDISGKSGEIYHAVHQFVDASNICMKYYDKNKESSYLKYWDVNNLHG